MMFGNVLRAPLVITGFIGLIEGVIGVVISRARYAELGNVGPAFVSEWERSCLAVLLWGGLLLAGIGVILLCAGILRARTFRQPRGAGWVDGSMETEQRKT